MNWLEILDQIFDVCIVPLIGILTTVLVNFIRQKMNESRLKSKSETAVAYLTVLEDTIITCVQATNQTYVEGLKNKNAFDAEAQKAALQMTYEAVVAILADDAKTYIAMVVGDVETYIKEKIEQKVVEAKK